WARRPRPRGGPRPRAPRPRAGRCRPCGSRYRTIASRAPAPGRGPPPRPSTGCTRRSGRTRRRGRPRRPRPGASARRPGRRSASLPPARPPPAPPAASPASVRPSPLAVRPSSDPPLRLRLLVAPRPEDRGGTVQPSVAPRVALGAVAVVVGVAVLDDDVEAAELLREPPRLGLRQVHEGRVDAEIGAEGEAERPRHRLDEVEAAVGVAAVVRLAHAADEV